MKHQASLDRPSSREVFVVDDDGTLIQKQPRLGQAYHDRRKSVKDSENDISS